MLESVCFQAVLLTPPSRPLIQPTLSECLANDNARGLTELMQSTPSVILIF